MPHIELRSDLFGITSLLDYRSATAGPICDLTQLLLRGPSSLLESERELIATYVSYLNNCTFCTAAHAAATCLLPEGNLEQIEALKHSFATAPLTDKMRALLHIAAKVQQSGQAVQISDADAARAAGATDLEIHDTVLIAALFCMYNRYVDGLAAATPSDPNYYEALGKRITTRGYAAPTNGYQTLTYEPKD